MDQTSFQRSLIETFHLSESQAEHIWRFFELFQDESSVMNLTGLKDEKSRQIKLFIDSLFLLLFVPLTDVHTVLDVGTGGGFPGVPLAIAQPEATFTLIDGRKKKIDAVGRMVTTLGLSNATVRWARAEDLVGETWDLVVTRALAHLDEAVPRILPLVSEGGRAVLYLGPNEDVSSERLQKLFHGAYATELFFYDLPEEMGKRVLLVVRRVR